MKYFAFLFVMFFCCSIIGCKKKTPTTTATTAPVVVHYDTFTVHYWRLDSAKNALSDNRTQNFIFESNGATDTTFSEIRKFKSIGSSTVTYFIASKYMNGTYDLTPFFLYARGTKTSNSSSLETFIGKSYYTNGKTNQIENLTLQKVN
jgi:hypothetical protein